MTSSRLIASTILLGLSLTAGCGDDASCTVLGTPPPAALTGRLEVGSMQVQIEARIVGVNQDAFRDLGVTFPLQSPVVQDSGGSPGSGSDEGRDVIVSPDVTGGAPGALLLVPAAHQRDSFLPVVNVLFQSVFTDAKAFPMLPLGGCVTFDPSAVLLPTGFPGGAAVSNLPAANPGLAGGQVLYSLFDATEASDLLSLIESDGRNAVVDAPVLRLYSGQRAMVVAQDVEPVISEVQADFRSRIESVTPSPFGIFSGPTLDVRPAITPQGGVELEIHLDTQALSFFFSTPFGVDGDSADLEIPLLRPSSNATRIVVADGQTVVLGGLIEPGQTTPRDGLPGLNSLPVVGNLFRQKFDQDGRQELVIFLTPKILNTP